MTSQTHMTQMSRIRSAFVGFTITLCALNTASLAGCDSDEIPPAEPMECPEPEEPHECPEPPPPAESPWGLVCMEAATGVLEFVELDECPDGWVGVCP